MGSGSDIPLPQDDKPQIELPVPHLNHQVVKPVGQGPSPVVVQRKPSILQNPMSHPPVRHRVNPHLHVYSRKKVDVIPFLDWIWI
jgi:hypothetical protein